DGIEYCLNAVTVDLSANSITDISPLFGLTAIEELNLSDNKIGYIDALSNLLKLKTIDLSNNQIDDISPLFDLPKLESCDISGNKVPSTQIQELEELGVSVNHD
ncbi:MAG TPA: leucine-rich repeat domain-containing protein, partial [Prolixibacteraceae bacterium]